MYRAGRTPALTVFARASSFNFKSACTYIAVVSNLLTAVNRLETTALYAQVATDLLREVISPLENLYNT